LINEYQGRLLRLAISRVPQRADAEDVVQNTFTSFVKVVDSVQIKISLESYLFGILRNEIVNLFRTQRAQRVCLIQDVYCKKRDDTSADAFAYVRSPDPSISRYIRQNKQQQFAREILAEVLGHFVQSFQKAQKLYDLKMAELLFYCQLSNIDIARQLNVNAGVVRTFKHRCLKSIRDEVAERYSATDFSTSYSDNLLTEIWEEQRLSCLKRSTLAAFLLENLPPEWFDYVDFHLTTMGCLFCRANFKDLQEEQWTSKQHQYLQQRIIASTVGFLSKS
jgi:RNA polymerase sigma factor (sigma-70 family)